MKLFIQILSLFFIVVTANADSLHPCTPYIQAQPSVMTCRQDGKFYDIRIRTLMSDRSRGCTEENQSYFEYKNATVEVYSNKKLEKKIELSDSEFSYTFNSFKAIGSEPMDLNNCVMPPHGGVSVGN